MNSIHLPENSFYRSVIRCCSLQSIWYRENNRPVYQASLDSIRGVPGATKPPSIRLRSYWDICIWSCLGQPSPEYSNNHLLLLCFSQQRRRGLLRQTAGCAPPPCKLSMPERWRKDMRKYIKKRSYGDSHAQWRERKVSSALPPP